MIVGRSRSLRWDDRIKRKSLSPEVGSLPFFVDFASALLSVPHFPLDFLTCYRKRMTDAILPGLTSPGNIKRLCIAPSTSFCFLLASSKTDQPTRERTHTLSLSTSLSLYPGRFQPHTHGHLNTKEHIQHCSSASFRRPFLTDYFLLLNQMDLETSGWMLNSCSAIYNCFLLSATYSSSVSFCLKLLLKLPNWKLSISSSTYLFFLLT